MLQSWNKFCFQGGLLEVRVQLPAAVDAQSQNPDLGQGDNARASTIAYYPTWPGIWAMGNLGRAIFSASTYRRSHTMNAAMRSSIPPRTSGSAVVIRILARA